LYVKNKGAILESVQSPTPQQPYSSSVGILAAEQQQAKIQTILLHPHYPLIHSSK